MSDQCDVALNRDFSGGNRAGKGRQGPPAYVGARTCARRLGQAHAAAVERTCVRRACQRAHAHDHAHALRDALAGRADRARPGVRELCAAGVSLFTGPCRRSARPGSEGTGLRRVAASARSRLARLGRVRGRCGASTWRSEQGADTPRPGGRGPRGARGHGYTGRHSQQSRFRKGPQGGSWEVAVTTMLAPLTEHRQRHGQLTSTENCPPTRSCKHSHTHTTHLDTHTHTHTHTLSLSLSLSLSHTHTHTYTHTHSLTRTHTSKLVTAQVPSPPGTQQ
jgi:hypothetical protein